jgi:hypothetical protein
MRGDARAIAFVTVAASFLLAGCDLGGDEKTAASESPTVEAPQVMPPEDLTAVPKSFSVRLRWRPSAEGTPAEQFDINRNNRLITSVAGTQTTFVDDQVMPGKKYTYEVIARVGDVFAERVWTPALTTKPPLTKARLEGNFNIVARLESQYGYISSGRKRTTLGLNFFPKCTTGPCRRIEWQDLHLKRFKGVLVRTGKRYHGTYTGFFGSTCSGTHTTSNVTLEFEVTKARAYPGALRGEWHATQIKGTLRNSDPSQLGCVSAGRTHTITGVLYPSSL